MKRKTAANQPRRACRVSAGRKAPARRKPPAKMPALKNPKPQPELSASHGRDMVRAPYIPAPLEPRVPFTPPTELGLDMTEAEHFAEFIRSKIVWGVAAVLAALVLAWWVL